MDVLVMWQLPGGSSEQDRVGFLMAQDVCDSNKVGWRAGRGAGGGEGGERR